MEKATGSRRKCRPVALLPEDRRWQGLVMEVSIERDFALTGLECLGRAALVRKALERGRAADRTIDLSAGSGVGLSDGGGEPCSVSAFC